MGFAPIFELGYVFTTRYGCLDERSLARLSDISSKMLQVSGELRPRLFSVSLEVELSSRTNTGLFEVIHFASFPGTEFERREQRGIRMAPYCEPAFAALEFQFRPIFESPAAAVCFSEEDKERLRDTWAKIDSEVLTAQKEVVATVGVPDYFTWNTTGHKKLSVGFGKLILPAVKAIPAGLKDFHNQYLAVVTPETSSAYYMGKVESAKLDD
jgi:hypothetical protein